MPYDKTKPYSCPCCGYWNGDMKYDYYRHQKPLIKDEKVRKAIRAWAEANDEDGETRLKYSDDTNRLSTKTDCIEFNCWTALGELKHGKEYTITELCGEEEE